MSDRERWEEIQTDLWCDSPGLSHELACKRIAELEALLPAAFDAGMAYSAGSGREFRQTHPDRETWVRQALGETDA
jgi:hypothetical protein